MEQSNYTPSQEKHMSMPLKIFEMVIFIVVVIGAGYYFFFYPKMVLQREQAQIQKQKEEAIAKRDANLCPAVTSPFDGSAMTDKECITSIKQLTSLDALNTLVIRAIKEKNEKLCGAVEKSFNEVCVKAVRDAISGKVKPPVNPLLGQ